MIPEPAPLEDRVNPQILSDISTMKTIIELGRQVKNTNLVTQKVAMTLLHNAPLVHTLSRKKLLHRIPSPSPPFDGVDMAYLLCRVGPTQMTLSRLTVVCADPSVLEVAAGLREYIMDELTVQDIVLEGSEAEYVVYEFMPNKDIARSLRQDYQKVQQALKGTFLCPLPSTCRNVHILTPTPSLNSSQC